MSGLMSFPEDVSPDDLMRFYRTTLQSVSITVTRSTLFEANANRVAIYAQYLSGTGGAIAPQTGGVATLGFQLNTNNRYRSWHWNLDLGIVQAKWNGQSDAPGPTTIYILEGVFDWNRYRDFIAKKRGHDAPDTAANYGYDNNDGLSVARIEPAAQEPPDLSPAHQSLYAILRRRRRLRRGHHPLSPGKPPDSFR